MQSPVTNIEVEDAGGLHAVAVDTVADAVVRIKAPPDTIAATAARSGAMSPTALDFISTTDQISTLLLL